MGLDPVGCIRRRIDQPGWIPFRPKMDWSRMSIPNGRTLLRQVANDGGSILIPFHISGFVYLGPIVCLVRASSTASVRRCWIYAMNCHWLQPCSVSRTSVFRRGSSSAGMLFNSNDGEPRIWMAMILIFGGWRQSSDSNGSDHQIQTAVANLELELLWTSDSNGAAIRGFELLWERWFWTVMNLLFKQHLGTDTNGGEPRFQTTTIHLDLETIRTCCITRKPSKGSFCLQISRDLNWRRMCWDPVRRRI